MKMLNTSIIIYCLLFIGCGTQSPLLKNIDKIEYSHTYLPQNFTITVEKHQATVKLKSFEGVHETKVDIDHSQFIKIVNAIEANNIKKGKSRKIDCIGGSREDLRLFVGKNKVFDAFRICQNKGNLDGNLGNVFVKIQELFPKDFDFWTHENIK